MLNINVKYNPSIILILLILCSGTAMTDWILSRNAFILVSIVITVYGVINFNKIEGKKEKLLISAALLAIGISQYLWCHLFPAPKNSPLFADQSYRITYQYFMLSAIPTLLLSNNSNKENPLKYRNAIAFISVIGISYMCLIVFENYIKNPGQRLMIGSVATTIAYSITIQSLMTIHTVRVLAGKFKKALLFFVTLITLIALLFTETRSAIFLYPNLLFLYFSINKPQAIKKIVGGYVLGSLVLLIAIIFLFPATSDRIKNSYYEISNYSTYNNTSLGARISMWKSGIYSFEKHPLGQSAESRYKDVITYMDKYENKNPEAKRNAIFHLHNDFIEVISLQGVFGAIALASLFMSIILLFYKSNSLRYVLPLFILPVIVIGMVDTLFIYKKFMVMLLAQVWIYYLLIPESFEKFNPMSSSKD